MLFASTLQLDWVRLAADTARNAQTLDSTPFWINILIRALFPTSMMVAGIVGWRLAAEELSLRLDVMRVDGGGC